MTPVPSRYHHLPAKLFKHRMNADNLWCGWVAFEVETLNEPWQRWLKRSIGLPGVAMVTVKRTESFVYLASPGEQGFEEVAQREKESTMVAWPLSQVVLIRDNLLRSRSEGWVKWLPRFIWTRRTLTLNRPGREVSLTHGSFLKAIEAAERLLLEENYNALDGDLRPRNEEDGLVHDWLDQFQQPETYPRLNFV